MRDRITVYYISLVDMPDRKSSITSNENAELTDETENSTAPLDNSLSTAKRRNKIDKYSTRYRIFKTLLLILAWISYGLNYEIISPTLEDLKVYLDVNYSSLSFGLVLRNIGYLGLTLFFGLILDKVSSYAELLMGISSVIIAICKINLSLTSLNHVFSMYIF